MAYLGLAPSEHSSGNTVRRGGITKAGNALARLCDVSVDGQLDAVFEEIATKWGRLDFALHSIGYARAEDLHGRIIDCSAEDFAFAMQVSTHPILRMAKLSEPLMATKCSPPSEQRRLRATADRLRSFRGLCRQGFAAILFLMGSFQ
jgi:NAD(P)-dependent dehydrogenase (short-subunit alcohol dehydrogenase family)